MWNLLEGLVVEQDAMVGFEEPGQNPPQVGKSVLFRS
jgi:hypothetical protein